MSEDYHRPTLTFPSGAYSATQVRLYGVAASSNSLSEFVQVISQQSGLASNQWKKLAGAMKAAGLNENGTTPYHFIRLDMKKLGSAFVLAFVNDPANQTLSAGVVVGYSFEGHCYDLPKPKVMLIPAQPTEIPLDDCGFDRKNDAADPTKNRYRVWIVDKLVECVELDMNQGFVEQLVLEANLPGNRSPTMYAGRARLGHRSGQLRE